MTRILQCDSGSVFFPDSGFPTFTDPKTEQSVKLAANYLKSSCLPLAFPTETVYGLGASALCSTAVANIFNAKGRPSDNPLIVHVSSIEMLQRLLPKDYTIPAKYSRLMQSFWPGPLTLLFPVNPKVVPAIVTAGHSTVAVRMPSHPIARALIALSDLPLAAPSANTSGRPSPTRATHVSRDLQGKIEYILDGGSCEVGVESTVVDGLGEESVLKVLRPGGIVVEDLEKCLQGFAPNIKIQVHHRDFHDTQLEMAPTTPGMKYRHYSPSVPVVVLMRGTPPSGTRSRKLQELVATVSMSLELTKTEPSFGLMTLGDSTLLDLLQYRGIAWHQFPLGSRSELSVMASRLYDGLIELEGQSVDCILIEGVDEIREGLAIMNRIVKAANELYWIV